MIIIQGEDDGEADDFEHDGDHYDHGDDYNAYHAYQCLSCL